VITDTVTDLGRSRQYLWVGERTSKFGGYRKYDSEASRVLD